MSHWLFCTTFLMFPIQPPEGRVETPAAESLKPEPEWKAIARGLWFDPKSRRLVVRARVVLREGPLEHLLCLKGTKEHEAILATEAPPRQIHAGLLLTGAEPGHPVRFVPKFEPPTGSTIRIELAWKKDGKILRADARDWVRDEKTKKHLPVDWVFAGSELYEDPATKKMQYAADEGDLITVANFGSAILDVPLTSSASDAERVFSAATEAIPPVGIEVFLILGARPGKEAGNAGGEPTRRP